MKYEYKVIKVKVNDAEDLMNQMSKDGWRVVSTSPNLAMGYGIIITFEKEVK